MFEAGAIAAALAEFLPSRDAVSFVDAGCGDGRFAQLLADVGRQTWTPKVGIDRDVIRLIKARETFSRLVSAELDSIPLAIASVDLAICNSTLEHVVNVEGALRELSRVLRPGGLLVLTVPSVDFESQLFGYRIRAWSGRSAAAAAWARAKSDRIQHLHYYPLARWCELLEQAGLQLRAAREIVPAPAVTIADPLQWIRDHNIGGSRYSRRIPTGEARDLPFRLIRIGAIAVEWLLCTALAALPGNKENGRFGGYLLVASHAE